MAGIGLSQLTAKLIKNRILSEGTSEQELLVRLKDAGLVDDSAGEDVLIQASQLGKLLSHLRGGEKKEIVRDKTVDIKKTSPASGSKIVFKKKNTQTKSAVKIKKSEPVSVSKTKIVAEPVKVKKSDTVPTAPEPKVEIKSEASVSDSDAAAKDKRKSKLDYAEERRKQKKLKEERAQKKRQRKSKGLTASFSGESILETNFTKPDKPVVKEVKIPEMIRVSELAMKMSVKAAEVIKVMMKMGAMVTINQMIDQDTAYLVVDAMGHKPVLDTATTIEEEVLIESSVEGEEEPRAPVVTIMGHVDHGKTSLLDYIRTTKVTSVEAGGITQHIGAYRVATKKGEITFLDTPGHEAFTAMRARGAKCTDVVILVVAADDGVQPQTLEAIQHAKAADVPLVVAINKMDKPEADPDNIRTQLSQHGVISEAWGGEHMFQEISAKTGQGVDDLLDGIVLQAEMMELSAVSTGLAKGVVIESRLDKGKGHVSTVLVTSGELNKGDIILAGREYGRVRMMRSDDGSIAVTAGPSFPVEVAGLSGSPIAGDDVVVVQSERKAREVAQFRQGKFREYKLAKQQAAKLENLFESVDKKGRKELNIVLKADVQGSVEAIMDSLHKLSTDEVKVRFVAYGVGAITESDVNLAVASAAVIVGFNVRAGYSAKQLAQKETVDLRYYSIIYDLINEVKSAMSGMLAPEIQEKIVGLARVQDVFRSSKIGAIAGCLVEEGSMREALPIRVLRDNVVIFEGELESLRRFKDEVKEVKNGTECGVGVKNYNDIKVGDQIECFERVSVARTLT